MDATRSARSADPTSRQRTRRRRVPTSAPGVEFELLNLSSGETEQAFADFEAADIGGELTGRRGEGLTEMIERHGPIAGDLTRGVGRQQRLGHGLEAAFEEVIEAHVGAEQREEIVIQRAGRLAGDNGL